MSLKHVRLLVWSRVVWAHLTGIPYTYDIIAPTPTKLRKLPSFHATRDLYFYSSCRVHWQAEQMALVHTAHQRRVRKIQIHFYLISESSAVVTIKYQDHSPQSPDQVTVSAEIGSKVAAGSSCNRSDYTGALILLLAALTIWNLIQESIFNTGSSSILY